MAVDIISMCLCIDLIWMWEAVVEVAVSLILNSQMT